MSDQNQRKRRENKSRKKARVNTSSTRDSILDSASKIMNRKGFADSSISEIAQDVGIKEPVIYQYFKGKEDLLFSIVENEMEKYHAFLRDQLQGIRGAYNKLRKLVWSHLRFNDVNREYITLVILECRSNANFYQTDAYRSIRRYAGILRSILDEGAKEGVFRSDINLALVRDIIFGLVDFQAITCLISEEIKDAAPDHEDCMRLLERILLVRPGPDIPTKEKRHRILQAGVEAFAEKGSNATISEIAKQAGVADGTVYEYFKNKEELLFSIPEERFKEHLSQLEEDFSFTDPLRKVHHFIGCHFHLYLTDRDFLRVFLMITLLNRRFYSSKAYEGLGQYMRVLETLVREGIDDGTFASDCNVRVFRNMFLGAFTHMMLRWIFINKETAVNKFEEINEVSDLLADSLVDKGTISSVYR
jgi:TetR/AcrR family fatty acid metabolism transcriptional regulator